MKARSTQGRINLRPAHAAHKVSESPLTLLPGLLQAGLKGHGVGQCERGQGTVGAVVHEGVQLSS